MSTTCTGFSALIQAATSQLGLLAETVDAGSDGSHLNSIEIGYGSAASSEMATSPPLGPSRTPMIVPENDHSNGKLSFPEQLMTLLMDPNNADVVTFLPDGKYFAIRRKEFSETLLYNHFHLTNFEEFLELIRGWGFARVNCSEDPANGNSNDSVTSANAAKAAIHVFRHPHFKRNHQVDMQQLRFGSKKHSHRAIDTARVMNAVPAVAKEGGKTSHSRTPSQASVIEKSTSDDFSTGSSKRRLSPSHVGRDTTDTVMKEQRLGDGSHAEPNQGGGTPPIVPAVSASLDHSDPPQPRRSSIELRGAAQAIATSKLKLSSQEMDVETKEQSSLDNQRVPTGRKQERRNSTASLVDGGVEAATHTIVTDAIETLLFDESHTRETFKKHEKELSTSSLPGVVPISKQLFAGAPSNASISSRLSAATIACTETSHKQTTKGTFTISNGESSSSAPTSYIGLEAATRGSSNSAPPRKVTDHSTTSSPSRLEAAAALVSQSRLGRDAAAKAFAHNSSGTVYKAS
ncbi:MAG: hypothetical protein SGILL_002867 [Bacillariaceae sp.]